MHEDVNPFADPVEIGIQYSAPHGSSVGQSRAEGRWPIRSQVLVLAGVVASAGLLGFTAFRSLAGIHLSADGLVEASQWSWGVLLGMVLTCVAAVLAVISLIRTESSRLIPAISVVAGFMLPPIAIYLGLRWGLEVASQSVGEDIAALVSSEPGAAFIAWLSSLVGG